MIITVAVMSSCNQRVEIGYVGMLLTVNGFEGDVLGPGKHECWGRDRLPLLEAKETTMTEDLDILCADDLNFKFSINVRSLVDVKTSEELKELFNRQGANIIWEEGKVGILPYSVLYNTYLKPIMSAVPRGVVSKYETTQIRENREKIEKEIEKQIKLKIKGTPIQIRDVSLSNFDYPEIITRAQEIKKKREVDIQAEGAQQALDLLRMDNRMKLAEKAKVVRAVEAEAEATYLRILGKAVSNNYLKLRTIEANQTLYERVGEGDKMIFNSSGAIPTIPVR